MLATKGDLADKGQLDAVGSTVRTVWGILFIESQE